MRATELRKERVDLRTYPEVCSDFDPTSRLVLGDMHGNALKLLYLLIRYGIVKLSAEDYNAFQKIYSSFAPADSEDPTRFLPLTQDQLDTCRRIISKADAVAGRRLCLVGDLLADRGNNDLLTLWLIRLLSQKGVDLKIILSNHDLEFIRYIEKCFDTGCYFRTQIFSAQAHSLLALIEAYRNRLVTRDEIEELYGYYKKHLELFSCELDGGGRLVFVNHAPSGLTVMRQAARRLGVSFLQKSPAAILKSVADVNVAFRKYVKTKTVYSALINRITKPDTGDCDLENPFVALTWAREELPHKERPSDLFAGALFIHGHTRVDDPPAGVLAIDDDHGVHLSAIELDDFLVKNFGCADVLHPDEIYPNGEIYVGEYSAVLVTKAPDVVLTKVANQTFFSAVFSQLGLWASAPTEARGGAAHGGAGAASPSEPARGGAGAASPSEPARGGAGGEPSFTDDNLAYRP